MHKLAQITYEFDIIIQYSLVFRVNIHNPLNILALSLDNCNFFSVFFIKTVDFQNHYGLFSCIFLHKN